MTVVLVGDVSRVLDLMVLLAQHSLHVADAASLASPIPLLAEHVNKTDRLAALSSLLSRQAATPGVLARIGTDDVTKHLTRRLRGLLAEGNVKLKLKYALLAVGGVLRVREVEPWALLADRSEQASDLVEVLSGIQTRLRASADANRLAAVTSELITLLSGRGGRPDILSVIDDLPDPEVTQDD